MPCLITFTTVFSGIYHNIDRQTDRQTDVKNAFNSIQRSSLLKSISSSFPSLYNHVYQMYSTDSSLIYQNGKTLHIIPSEEGVHQGDPLGPFLFSIAIHQSLGETQSQNPEVRCLAYLDDIFMVGQSDHVFSTFVDLKSNFNTLGLQIQDKKCEVFCPPPALNQDMSPWRGILVSQAGMMVLGSPIGTDDFIKRSCIEIAESGHHLCNELTTLDDPQSAMLLLRYSHVSRISHLARTIFPESFRAAAILHDQLTYSTFVSVLGIEDIIDEKWLQATLPVRYGGFGLTSMQSISPPAFVSCWSQSLHVLPERFPELRSQIDSFICDIISPNSPENFLLPVTTVPRPWAGVY